MPFSFNRKEKKHHGETGLLVGATIENQVLVIDDVISSGISIAESIKTIQNNKGEVACIIIALDRKEKKDNTLEDEETMLVLKKIPIVSIIDFFDILEFTRIKPELSSHQEPLLTYHEKYGII